MNDQQLIDYVRATGKVRVIQVSDKFDIAPHDASERLRELVQSGQLKESSGFAPNGHACPVFDVPDASPGIAPSGFPIPVTRMQQAAKPIEPEPEPTPAQAPPAAPEPEVSQRSKLQTAIDYIIRHGEATSAELATAMGLEAGEYASTYVRDAVKDGRLVLEGRTYKIGDGKPMTSAPKGQNWRTDPVGKSEVRTPTPPQSAKTATVTTMPSHGITGSFRVGLWSDGVIELQRDGVTVVTITERESEHLMKFIASAKVPAAA